MSALAIALTALAVIAVSLTVVCWALVTTGPPALGDDLAGEGGGTVKQSSLESVHAAKLSRGSHDFVGNRGVRLP
jgi:hypothetical protein